MLIHFGQMQLFSVSYCRGRHSKVGRALTLGLRRPGLHVFWILQLINCLMMDQSFLCLCSLILIKQRKIKQMIFIVLSSINIQCVSGKTIVVLLHIQQTIQMKKKKKSSQTKNQDIHDCRQGSVLLGYVATVTEAGKPDDLKSGPFQTQNNMSRDLISSVCIAAT